MEGGPPACLRASSTRFGRLTDIAVLAQLSSAVPTRPPRRRDRCQSTGDSARRSAGTWARGPRGPLCPPYIGEACARPEKRSEGDKRPLHASGRVLQRCPRGLSVRPRSTRKRMATSPSDSRTAIRSAWAGSARMQRLVRRSCAQVCRLATGGEIDRLVRLLARRGLLEDRLAGARKGEDQGGDKVVIEPQMPDYWPRTPPLGDAGALVLSRSAYLRRRGNEMVLESPRAGALFRIHD